MQPSLRHHASATGQPASGVQTEWPQLRWLRRAAKSQGQTFRKVGLYLPNDVFCHGQLYVALSRVSSEDSIVVLANKGFHHGKPGVYTKNFVYKEALS